MYNPHNCNTYTIIKSYEKFMKNNDRILVLGSKPNLKWLICYSNLNTHGRQNVNGAQKCDAVGCGQCRIMIEDLAFTSKPGSKCSI